MSGIRDRSVVRSPVIPSAKYCCSGSLLRLAKGSTTIDRRGAIGGSAARGCRVDPRRRLAIFAHLADKAHAPARHGANDTLRRATVVNRLARRIEARRQCRIRDDPPAPDAFDQIILADDPATVAHQIDEKVEHLRFERDRLGPAAQFASLDIEHVIAKPENHPVLLRLGPSVRFLRKRQAHLKGKSSPSQSLPLRGPGILR